MKLKPVLFLTLFGILHFGLFLKGSAQNKFKQNGIDSAAIDGKISKDKAMRDSIAQAIVLKRKADSTARELAKLKLQAFRDSVLGARIAKRKADSLLREQAKLVLLEKKRVSDSLAQDRIRKQDSARLAFSNRQDSIRQQRELLAKQKKALDKYKNSKRYKDSIAGIKKARLDSLATSRTLKQQFAQARAQQVKDSMLSVRNHINDSIKAVRKQVTDSTKAALAANIEKQKAIRQKASDSLAAIKSKRDSLLASKKPKTEPGSAKEKEAKKNALAIKMAHDKKQAEWTNEKLLKRRWSLPRRIFQNTVTRYNYFYNARRKYFDAIATMKKNHKDDFTQLIPIYPYDIRKAGTNHAGEMDSVIKKSSFSTQIHDPRSKWFDNLYFLMGRASFVKNDFDGAITTFQFIANEYKNTPTKKKSDQRSKEINKEKEFGSIATVDNRKGIRKLRHHPVRNQALVWLAKSYIEAEQYSEATALISTLEKDKVFPKRNKTELYFAKTNLEIAQDHRNEAIEALNNALKLKQPSLQRARAEFLIGQLYALDGNYEQSTAHFKKSISGKSNPEMDFYTKLFVAQNASKGGGDKKYAINQLDKLIKDPKFEKYKGEAYNALAAIYAEEEPTKAIEILTRNLKEMDNKNPLQKAKAYEMLGGLQYNLANYQEAKFAYDSASHFGTNPPLENINEINTRKDVLSDVVKNIDIIRYQDSLLLLAQKSEKEQKAIAKKEAERRKKVEEDKEENNTTVVALSPGVTTKSNWYFYNTSMLEKGAAEFKQKWGARKLEDNWRRRAAGTNMIAESSSEEGEEEEKKLLINGSVYETLLAEIPKTPAQKDKANDLIMNAFYNLGLIYYAQLNDYPHSSKAFDTLLIRYPSTGLKKQTYYGQYLDHSLMKNEAEAARYKKLLLDEFGQSEFAQLANNPDYFADLKDIEKIVDYYYDTTYMAYKNEQYNEALTRIAYAQNQFSKKPIIAKFDLLKAVCYAGLKDFKNCKTNLEDVIKKYPSSAEQAKAQELLNYLNSTSALDSNASDKTALVDSTKENTSVTEKSKGTAVYNYSPNDEHLLMVFVSKVDGRLMALKSGLSDFNLFKHESEELATGQNLFTVQQGVVTVSKFSNAVFAKIYMNDVLKEPTLFKQFRKEDYNVCLISTGNFSELLKTRDILGYLDFYSKNYK